MQPKMYLKIMYWKIRFEVYLKMYVKYGDDKLAIKGSQPHSLHYYDARDTIWIFKNQLKFLIHDKIGIDQGIFMCDIPISSIYNLYIFLL